MGIKSIYLSVLQVEKVFYLSQITENSHNRLWVPDHLITIQNMADFVELALVVGDMHIPQRAIGIPEKFQRLLVPNKMQHVLCTGNLTSKEQIDELRALAPNVHVVRGSFDDDASHPESKIITIGQFKVGLISGHEVVPWGDTHGLAMFQRKLDVDILISGHTHKQEVVEFETGKKWLINPGSITGAYSNLTTDVTPSFMLLALQGMFFFDHFPSIMILMIVVFF